MRQMNHYENYPAFDTRFAHVSVQLRSSLPHCPGRIDDDTLKRAIVSREENALSHLLTRRRDRSLKQQVHRTLANDVVDPLIPVIIQLNLIDETFRRMPAQVYRRGDVR